MATLDQLKIALVNADKAGDMDAARKLAAVIRTAQKDTTNQIPDTQVPGTYAQAPEPSIIDKAIGTGEAALTTATGMAGGAIGMLGGSIAGIAKSMANGTYGTPEGVRSAEETAMNAARAMTYEPRTQSGKEQASFVGEAAQNLIPLVGVAPQLAELQTLAKPATVQAVNAVQSGASKLGAAAKQTGSALIERIPTRAQPEPVGPLADSVGAEAINPAQQARSIASRASPETQAALELTIKKNEPVNLKALQNQVEAETLPVPGRLTAGQAAEDAIMISNEHNLRGRNPEIVAMFDEQNKNLIDNVNAIKEKVAPDVYLQNPAEHADALISSYETLNNNLTATIRNNYKALEDANGGKFPLDTQAFVRAAEENIAKANRSRYVPSEVRGMLEEYKEGKPLDFNGFEEFRTILADDARKASRAGDGNTAKAISAVRDALESMPMEKGAENLKALADVARESAKQRFDLIKSDPAFKAVVDGKALADSFVNKYVLNADSSRVEAMLKNLQSVNPEARQILASSTMGHLKRAARVSNDSGVFAQDSFNNALAKLGNKAPLIFGQEGTNTLQQLGNVARKIKQQPSGSFVNNSNTATQLLAETGKSTAEGIGNTITGFVSMGNVKGGTAIRKLIEARSARKETSDIFKPGAGISAKESKMLEVKRKVLEAQMKKQAKSK